MHANDAIIKTVRAALEREARINLHRHPVTIRRDGDVLVLEGEVYDIAAKKLALGLAAAVAGVRGIIDRLRLVPSERKGDGAIRDGCVKFILGEPTLRNCEVRIHHKGRVDALRRVEPDAAGNIEIAVQDGVITLDGEVGSLSHKRIAGVLAWWTPGRRDVVDGLEVGFRRARHEVGLAAVEGHSGTNICAHLGVSRPTVTCWLDRYEAEGGRVK